MSTSDITGKLSRYMVEARDRSLPPEVARECRHRILDSLAAMVSGAHLKAGEMAIRFARHIIAPALVEGTVSFEDSHSYERMKDPKVLAVKERVELIADKSLMDPAAPRSGRVEVTLKDGRSVSHFTRHAPGTKENPLTTDEVSAKARSLMTPVLGAEKTEELILRVNALEEVKDVRELRGLLSVNGGLKKKT